MLDVVLKAVRENPGRRVLVLVSVENRYWFVDHVRDFPGVDMVNLET